MKEDEIKNHLFKDNMFDEETKNFIKQVFGDNIVDTLEEIEKKMDGMREMNDDCVTYINKKKKLKIKIIIYPKFIKLFYKFIC